MGRVFPLKNRQRENLKSGQNSQKRGKGGSPFGNKRKMSLKVVLTILFLLFFPANPALLISFSFYSFYLQMFASASFTCFTCFLRFLSAHVCLCFFYLFHLFPSVFICTCLPLCFFHLFPISNQLFPPDVSLNCNVGIALLNPSVSSSSSLHHLYSVASDGPFTNLKNTQL